MRAASRAMCVTARVGGGMFYAYERVMFGPITKDVNRTIPDLSRREIAVMVPLLALMFLMGFFPRPLLSRIEPSVNALLARTHTHVARLDSPRPISTLAAATGTANLTGTPNLR